LHSVTTHCRQLSWTTEQVCKQGQPTNNHTTASSSFDATIGATVTGAEAFTNGGATVTGAEAFTNGKASALSLPLMEVLHHSHAQALPKCGHEREQGQVLPGEQGQVLPGEQGQVLLGWYVVSPGLGVEPPRCLLEADLASLGSLARTDAGVDQDSLQFVDRGGGMLLVVVDAVRTSAHGPMQMVAGESGQVQAGMPPIRVWAECYDSSRQFAQVAYSL
jgi:hypothetical protein